MQQLVKGICGGALSWNKSPYFGNLLSKGLPFKSKQCFNLDRCFEVGYNSMLQATSTLVRAMDRERTKAGLPLSKRLDSIKCLSNQIEEQMVKDIRYKFPNHE